MITVKLPVINTQSEPSRQFAEWLIGWDGVSFTGEYFYMGSSRGVIYSSTELGFLVEYIRSHHRGFDTEVVYDGLNAFFEKVQECRAEKLTCL